MVRPEQRERFRYYAGYILYRDAKRLERDSLHLSYATFCVILSSAWR